MYVLFNLSPRESRLRLNSLLSVHLGDDFGLLILNLFVNLCSPAGLVTVSPGGICWLGLLLFLLGFLLLLLYSGSVGKSVGDRSLVSLVESVVLVLLSVLEWLTSAGVTCGREWSVTRGAGMMGFECRETGSMIKGEKEKSRSAS